MAILYDNLHKLPFDRFMDVAVTEDRALLIKEGEATPEELEACWEGLLSDFNEKMNGPKGEHRITLKSREVSLANKISRIAHLVSVWRHIPHPEVIKCLQAEGVGKGRKFARDTWQADMAYCLAQVRSKQQMLSKLREELGPVDVAEGDKPTYDRFYELLAAISKNEGRTIEPSISTLYFCTLYVRYMQSAKNDA